MVPCATTKLVKVTSKPAVHNYGESTKEMNATIGTLASTMQYVIYTVYIQPELQIGLNNMM